MDIQLFTKILKDKSFYDYKKMKYKYAEDFSDFLDTLKDLYYKELPLCDFDGKKIVYIENHAAINQSAIKLLLKSQDKHYGIQAAEDEIIATSAIESIDFSRDSVRNILKGFAPKDEQENRIMGLKKGLEFIADATNKISEENLYKLYMMTVGNFLDDENKLEEGKKYRHDVVYIVSDHIEHTGLPAAEVPKHMADLIAFANTEDNINDLVKAAIIHFYCAYIHPYFDGNGRMARLLHLWFLIQKGYQSALFIPFSSKIEKSRKAYYDAYTTIEQNKKYSNVIDATPFVIYFIENVYNQMTDVTPVDTLSRYDEVIKSGMATEKEIKLWQFVLSFYGLGEFSTKQLEKDFGDAAYATIRGFVLKFEELGLLTSTKYGARIKYKISK